MERTGLEKLQDKHKQIEDDNRKRKLIIKNAVQDRLMRTQREAHQLKQVQTELALVDQQLQLNVEVLRNHIEEASYSVAAARKRYESAEVEYVAAKLDFFTKEQSKDELTEKLYIIIQENETKKACKLKKIMLQLDVEVTSDMLSGVPTTGSDTVTEDSIVAPLSVYESSNTGDCKNNPTSLPNGQAGPPSIPGSTIISSSSNASPIVDTISITHTDGNRIASIPKKGQINQNSPDLNQANGNSMDRV